MAIITNNNIARAIYSTLVGKSEAERKETYARVVHFLGRRRLLSKASDILERLKMIANEEGGKIEAKVYTAKVLTESARKDIIQALSKKYPGKEIILDEHLKESLQGGWRIEIGDEVIDQSLKNKIKQLQEHLTHTI